MIELLPIDDELAATLAAGAAAFEARHRVRLEIAHGWVHDAVRQTQDLYRRVPRSAPWLGQLAVDGDRRVVGTCAFANDPLADGFAEIAYHTFPPFERRGHGTAMAAALVGIARREGTVRRVVARTLPAPGTSTRILERIGFRRDGEGVDPDAGPVWSWALLPAA